jgi:hypothetical protein
MPRSQRQAQMRGEDNKTVPGKDLTANIGKAYRSAPPEKRARPDAENDIQNPELDQAFDRMVEMHKVHRPLRENSLVTFPAPPAVSMPKTGKEALPEYECQECGHHNPSGNQFCGMCGAAREDVRVVLPTPTVRQQELAPPALAVESDIRHHHHHYHHDHYRNDPYLLLALVLLMGTVAWQQSQEFRRAQAPAAVAPASSRQQPPTQAQPNSVPAHMSTVPVPEPSMRSAPPPQLSAQAQAHRVLRGARIIPAPRNRVQPAMEPAPAPTVRPAARPVQQAGLPRLRTPAPQPFPVSSIAPYQTVTDQAIPVLPQFSHMPAKAASAK